VGRDVYAHKEALEDHFNTTNVKVEGLEKIESGQNKGTVKYSFANLMFLHHPMVIIDEAHNARTNLSFEALSRLHPSCIVELTATPDTTPPHNSNVLHRVSASELKAEDMIKMPIVLTVHKDAWQTAVSDALRTRERLAETAPDEPDYIRPILLIQAESKEKPANVEAVKQYLLDNELIPKEKIAIATGDQRELDDVKLFDKKCPIEIVITVQALKEGWDCSFAYVFCSTATIHSSKDVEQLLGRVLRMPYAKRRKSATLNKAYAHVSSLEFQTAAEELESCLIQMGFEDTEAKLAIESAQPSLPSLPLFLQRNPLTLIADRAPNLEGLTEHEQQSVVTTPNPTGGVTVELHGPVSPAVQEHVLATVPEPQQQQAAKNIEEHNAGHTTQPSLAERGEEIVVPKLCVRYYGEWLPFEADLMLDAAGWDITVCDAAMGDVVLKDDSKSWEFDVAGGKVVYQFVGEQQLDLNVMPGEWSQFDLVRWLDAKVRQPDITQERLVAWVTAAINDLLKNPGFNLATLVRGMFILVRKLQDKIAQCRTAAYERGYQELLFQSHSVVETTYEYSFSYDPDRYPANWFYDGRYRFKKHFYPTPGELQNHGEEFDCAVALDAQENIQCWVRNLANQPSASVWLQTSTDRFYPDFVAKLTDGRLLIVEYKGAHISGGSDAAEKDQLGELWARKSNGKALFLLAVRTDNKGRGVYDQLKAKIAAR